MENEKTIVGVYRVLYLLKDGEKVKSCVTFVCSAPSETNKVLKTFVDNPQVVRVSLETILYFDCNDIGKIVWLKNDFIEKKEGEGNA